MAGNRHVTGLLSNKKKKVKMKKNDVCQKRKKKMRAKSSYLDSELDIGAVKRFAILLNLVLTSIYCNDNHRATAYKSKDRGMFQLILLCCYAVGNCHNTGLRYNKKKKVKMKTDVESCYMKSLEDQFYLESGTTKRSDLCLPKMLVKFVLRMLLFCCSDWTKKIKTDLPSKMKERKRLETAENIFRDFGEGTRLMRDYLLGGNSPKWKLISWKWIQLSMMVMMGQFMKAVIQLLKVMVEAKMAEAASTSPRNVAFHDCCIQIGNNQMKMNSLEQASRSTPSRCNGDVREQLGCPHSQFEFSNTHSTTSSTRHHRTKPALMFQEPVPCADESWKSRDSDARKHKVSFKRDTLSDTNTSLLNLEDIGKFGKACPRSKAKNKPKSMSAKTMPTSAKTGNADDVKQRLHAVWDDRSRDLKDSVQMKHMMLMECSPGSIYPENMKFSDCNVQIGENNSITINCKISSQQSSPELWLKSDMQNDSLAVVLHDPVECSEHYTPRDCCEIDSGFDSTSEASDLWDYSGSEVSDVWLPTDDDANDHYDDDDDDVLTIVGKYAVSTQNRDFLLDYLDDIDEGGIISECLFPLPKYFCFLLDSRDPNRPSLMSESGSTDRMLTSELDVHYGDDDYYRVCQKSKRNIRPFKNNVAANISTNNKENKSNGIIADESAFSVDGHVPACSSYISGIPNTAVLSDVCPTEALAFQDGDFHPPVQIADTSEGIFWHGADRAVSKSILFSKNINKGSFAKVPLAKNSKRMKSGHSQVSNSFPLVRNHYDVSSSFSFVRPPASENVGPPWSRGTVETA